jgi:hypothetical protein
MGENACLCRDALENVPLGYWRHLAWPNGVLEAVGKCLEQCFQSSETILGMPKKVKTRQGHFSLAV